MKDLLLHHFEKRTGVDHTPLIIGRVPFCEMKKCNGFAPAIYAEVRARSIEMSDEKKRLYPEWIKKLKENTGNDKDFNPVTPFENFIWYNVD